jgi:hypothetical protein
VRQKYRQQLRTAPFAQKAFAAGSSYWLRANSNSFVTFPYQRRPLSFSIFGICANRDRHGFGVAEKIRTDPWSHGLRAA